MPFEGDENMADTKKVEEIKDITVSAKVLAECIGVGDRMIRYLADEGIVKRNGHGRYLLLESVKNYILTIKISKAGESVKTDFDADMLDLNHEKAVNEAGALISALGVIIGLIVTVIHWIDHQKEQDTDIADLKEEQCLLSYGVLACLKGLKELGCNGPVNEAINKIEKHLNQKAHDQ